MPIDSEKPASHCLLHSVQLPVPMSVRARLNYYRRIFPAHILLPGKSQLTFWHDQPQVNPGAAFDRTRRILHALRRRRRTIAGASRCRRHSPARTTTATSACSTTPSRSRSGDWETSICFCAHIEDRNTRRKFLAAADWLVKHLEPNSFGVPVWNHSVRLGVPNSAESTVVFRTRPGAGNFLAGARRAGNRHDRVSRSRCPRVRQLFEVNSGRWS